MEATETAWDYVSQPVRQPEVSARMKGLADGTDSRSLLEVLTETRALAGSHDQIHVRSVRIR